jgi:hypothetical protein
VSGLAADVVLAVGVSPALRSHFSFVDELLLRSRR